MQLTFGQAARQAGISKSYLSKLIKTGKISAERQPKGEFCIDPSELDRLPHIRRVNTPQKPIDTPRPPPDAWLKEREALIALGLAALSLLDQAGADGHSGSAHLRVSHPVFSTACDYWTTGLAEESYGEQTL